MTEQVAATNAAILAEKGHVQVAKQRASHPVKLYYEVYGNGPNKLLFMMGLGTSCSTWEFQVNYFGRLPDYQVCVFDNRGVGWSDAPAGLYTTTELAKDAFELLDHLGWSENVHVIGISMGGMIAQEMAYLRPEYIKSLCLTSSTSGGGIFPWAHMKDFIRLLFTRDPYQKISMAMALLYPSAWLDSPAPADSSHRTNRELMFAVIKARVARSRAQTIWGSFGQLSACFRHRVTPDRLIRIQENVSKILITTGTEDPFVKPECSYYLAEHLPAAEFEVFHDCGHDLPNEQKERYNALLDKHFRKAGLMNTSQEG